MTLRKKYDLQHSPSLLPGRMKQKAAAPSTTRQLLAGCRWDVSPVAKGKDVVIWEIRHLQAGASVLVYRLLCPGECEEERNWPVFSELNLALKKKKKKTPEIYWMVLQQSRYRIQNFLKENVW